MNDTTTTRYSPGQETPVKNQTLVELDGGCFNNKNDDPDCFGKMTPNKAQCYNCKVFYACYNETYYYKGDIKKT